MIIFIKIFKALKNAIFNRAVLLTALSFSTFVFPAIIYFFSRSQFKISLEQQQIGDVIFSLFVISLNLFITRKWLSFREVGIQKSGFLKSLCYSLIFVFLLRVIYLSGHQDAFKKVWGKTFIFYLPFIVFAFQEELMFRGIIFRVWEQRKGFLAALFISSTLFAIGHLVYPAMGFKSMDISSLITIALFGTAFILIAYRTKNIWGLSISHFLYNFSLLTVDSAVGDTEAKTGVAFLAMAASIFLPIGIDLFDRFLSKIKPQKIQWSFYLASLFSTIFFIIVISSLIEDLGFYKTKKQFCPYLESEKVKACVEENIKRADGCYGIDLILKQAEKKVNNNKKSLEILKENCLRLVNAKTHDFTGDGKEDVAMITENAECDNCHQKHLYIVSEDKIIFQKDTDDIWFWPAEKYPGFIIKYPLRKQGEALCCPTDGIVENYTIKDVSSNYKTFYKFDQHIEQYKY